MGVQARPLFNGVRMDVVDMVPYESTKHNSIVNCYCNSNCSSTIGATQLVESIEQSCYGPSSHSSISTVLLHHESTNFDETVAVAHSTVR
jgi:hypothetical protein